MNLWWMGAVLGLALAPLKAVAAEREALFAEIRACAGFVAAQSVEGLGEPTEGFGSTVYISEMTNETAGLIVERSHTRSSFDDETVELWECKIKNTRSSWPEWQAQNMRAVFENAQDIVPDLVATDLSGTFLRYHDCTVQDVPVSYSFNVHEAGSLYVSVSLPALDAFACVDTVKLNDLLYACIYEFAAEPWAEYRAETGERHPPDRRGLTPERRVADVLQGKIVKRVNPQEIEVQTDFGTVTVLQTDAPRVQCTIAALVRDEAGVLVASDAVAHVGEVLWFMRSVSGFYPGFYFQPGNQGFYTCATSFPHVALLVRNIALPNGDVTYTLNMEAVEEPSFVQKCAEHGG